PDGEGLKEALPARGVGAAALAAHLFRETVLPGARTRGEGMSDLLVGVIAASGPLRREPLPGPEITAFSWRGGIGSWAGDPIYRGGSRYEESCLCARGVVARAARGGPVAARADEHRGPEVRSGDVQARRGDPEEPRPFER